jgi:hypothetical protein
MAEQSKHAETGRKSRDDMNIQLHRWSSKSEDLALPLPAAVLQHLGISGPCTLTVNRAGQTLILRKKGSPRAWRIPLHKSVV